MLVVDYGTSSALRAESQQGPSLILVVVSSAFHSRLSSFSFLVLAQETYTSFSQHILGEVLIHTSEPFSHSRSIITRARGEFEITLQDLPQTGHRARLVKIVGALVTDDAWWVEYVAHLDVVGRQVGQ